MSVDNNEEVLKDQFIIEKIHFYNEKSWGVYSLKKSNNEITKATGIIKNAKAGMSVILTFNEVVHDIYGKQKNIISAIETFPDTKLGLIDFFSSFRGLGKVIASKLINEFDTNIIEIAKNNYEELANIKGISKSLAKSIKDELIEKETRINAILSLKDYNLTDDEKYLIYEDYKEKSNDAVIKNPYILLYYDISLRRVDNIAFSLGISKGDNRRFLAVLEYTLNEYISLSGNTKIDIKTYIKKIANYFDLSGYSEENDLKNMIDSNISSVGIIKVGEYYTFNDVMEIENEIVDKLVCIKNTNKKKEKFVENNEEKIISSISNIAIKENMPLTSNMLDGIMSAIRGEPFIITGGPGTGKTTLIKRIIDAFEYIGIKNIVVCAPTGRAAKRIAESNIPEFIKPLTIHRLLMVKYDVEKIGRFTFDLTNIFTKNINDQLDCDVLIVDEASMIDTFLIHALLCAIKDETRVIFIGDKDQLPPVGAGSFFKDMIDINFLKTILLEVNYRQNVGKIIEISNAIKNSDINFIKENLNNDPTDDLFFIKRKETEIIPTIINVIKERVNDYFKNKGKEIDFIKDVQILSPIKNSPNGVINLNNELQNIFNKKDKLKNEVLVETNLGNGNYILREGDKVMQIKNDYNKEFTEKSDGKYSDEVNKGIFNGDIGVVSNIYSDDEIIIDFLDGKTAKYSLLDVKKYINLAYAITIHKSQGSEFKVVLIPSIRVSGPLKIKNLIYTGVSRATDLLVIVGEERNFVDLVLSHEAQNKDTNFRDIIKNP